MSLAAGTRAGSYEILGLIWPERSKAIRSSVLYEMLAAKRAVTGEEVVDVLAAVANRPLGVKGMPADRTKALLEALVPAS